ncbi:hypothetical protein LTR22_018284 [Elasticomyces elasticus]|nr:hypothetical protein LTR22_018284 [Elasticomyces elasticus]KAK4924259.1 hypothetical protein LTR49_008559 [Elasticomyces elasticus]KAK5743409.1 hypothetical protein LTS12_023851 [Elasticomyces elasticus]
MGTAELWAALTASTTIKRAEQLQSLKGDQYLSGGTALRARQSYLFTSVLRLQVIRCSTIAPMRYITAALICTYYISQIHAQCDIPPLALAWTNTTVTADGLGVTRGVEMGIGTPNQIFALRPYTALNNTRVNNVADCGSVSNDTCIGGQGGVFSSQASSSYSVSIKGNWNGSEVDEEDSTGSYVYFNDKVSFLSAASVYGFPVVMESEPDGGSISGLPIGSNSSFLLAAVKGGVAPSQVVGLWPGSRSLAPVDGLMVVGGYDTSRVAGNFTTFPVSDASSRLPCPLQVNVTGLTFAGWSLLNNSDIMTACVEPYKQKFVFTPAIANYFARITGQNSTAIKGMGYNSTNPPLGELVVTLSNGYTTTISNSELFALRRGSDQYGRYAITNASVVEAGISDNRDEDESTQTPTLGGLFLTFNYLIIDYANDEFRMAPAVASSQDMETSLKTLCTPTPTPLAPPPSSPTPVPKYAGTSYGT